MAIYQRNGMVQREGQYAPNTDRTAQSRSAVTPAGAIPGSAPNVADAGTGVANLAQRGVSPTIAGGRRGTTNTAALQTALENGMGSTGKAIPRTYPMGSNSALNSAVDYWNANPATTASGTTTQSDYPDIALPGWDQTKWGDSSHNNAKYTAGRILANFPATTEGLAQAWPEIQKAFPNAKFDGKDAIDFGDGYGYVDVLQGAGVGGQAWQWIPGSEQTGSTNTSGASSLLSNSPYYDILNSGGSYSDKIMAYLMARLGR